jgi:hypothetical protein
VQALGKQSRRHSDDSALSGKALALRG